MKKNKKTLKKYKSRKSPPYPANENCNKKMKGNEGNEKVDYYSKTVQFKPYKTEYQETDIDDEDQNYPKAS